MAIADNVLAQALPQEGPNLAAAQASNLGPLSIGDLSRLGQNDQQLSAITPGIQAPGTLVLPTQNVGQAPPLNQSLAALQSTGGPVVRNGAAANAAPSFTFPNQGGGPGKAGWQPSTQDTTSEGLNLTPGPRNAIDEGRVNQEVAVDQMNRAVEDQYKAAPAQEAYRAAAHANLAVQQAADKAKYEQIRNDENAAERWNYDKAVAARDLAVSKGVDPNHFYHNQSTGSKIATMLALMSGGFVSGFKGGPNQAAEMLSKTVDNDIKAQQDNIENKKVNAAATESHYALFRKEGMDKDQAFSAAQLMARDQLDKSIDAELARPGTPMGRLALFTTKAKLAEDATDHQVKWAQATERKVTEKTAAKWALAGGGAGSNEAKEYNAYVDSWLKGDKKERLYSANEWHALHARPGNSPTGAAAEPQPGSGKMSPRLVKSVAQLNTEEKAAKDLKTLMEKGSSLSPTDRAKGDALASILREGGHKSVPEHPMDTFSWTEANNAGLDPVLTKIKAERDDIKEGGAGTGNVPDTGGP